MPIPSSGTIKFSDLRTEFTNNYYPNSQINISDYYANKPYNVTADVSNIPLIGAQFDISKFKGAQKNLLNIIASSSEAIVPTVPPIQNVIGATSNYYIKFLHQGNPNTSTTPNYTEYILTFPYNVISDILLVGGGGGGGASIGSGGGAGGLIYMASIIFNANTTYKIRVGAGGLGMQSATDNTTINGTSSILYDNSGNMLLTAIGGARGFGQNSISTQNRVITSNKSITITSNTAAIYNYTDTSNLLPGISNIIFTLGSINIGSLPSNKSYPILKNNNNIIIKPILLNETINSIQVITAYSNISNLNNIPQILDPIIWYKFNDANTFLQENKNIRNLTNNGATFDTTNFIKGKGSLSFLSTSSQYVQIPNTNIDFNKINLTTGITFTLWLRVNNSTPNWSRIFDFGTQSGGLGSRFIILSKHANFNRFNCEISNTAVDGNTTSYIRNQILITQLQTDNVWRFFAWTITPNGYWNIYVNNVNVYSGQQVVIPAFTLSTRYYYLGKSLYNTDGYLYGNIDDFRIYDFPLTAKQVSELYFGRVEIYSEPVLAQFGGSGSGGTKNNIYGGSNIQLSDTTISSNSKLYGYGNYGGSCGTTITSNYTYTGLVDTFNVPSNVNFVNIYCWGAGGGSGSSPLYSANGGYGGNGGFVQATLNVENISTLKIIVGQGGRKGTVGALSGYAFGGGGTVGVAGDGNWACPGGGGLSGVFVSNANITVSTTFINSAAIPIIIAGGGGGGGCTNTTLHGGNAGGLIGNNGSSANSYGNGGTQTIGGNAGTSSPLTPPNGQAGNIFKGGGVGGIYGGGGGAGYYGGGAGKYISGTIVAGGGGGSSYVNTSNFNLSTILVSPAPENGTRTVNGSTNKYYQANVGLGGNIGLNNGGDGLIVIEYFLFQNTLYDSAGGGGGAGSPGSNAIDTNIGIGGNGGDAKLINIVGSNEYYAGGGGGSSQAAITGLGGGLNGIYIGGAGTNNSSVIKISSAVANTGSGGGGSACDGANPQIGGNGSAGICIIKYNPYMYNPPESNVSLDLTNVGFVGGNLLSATVKNLNYIVGFSNSYNVWGGNWPHILLDRNTGTNWRVGVNNFNGFYNATAYLVNDFTGEWVWYKLPYTLMLKEYKVSSVSEGCPRLWKIYGSNNSTNWEEITEASVINDLAAFNAGSYTKTLTSFSKPYKYIAISITYADGSGSGSCVIDGFEVSGLVYNLTNNFYYPPLISSPTYTWQFFNNTDVLAGEFVLNQTLSKETNTLTSILNTVIATPSYIGVYIYDGAGVAYNNWNVYFISSSSTIVNMYNRYGNYSANYPTNRYAYIHIARATTNSVYANKTFQSLTNSALYVNTSSIYAHYLGDGPFTKSGSTITQWNDISGNNNHITKYKGTPLQSTYTGGTCGIIGSSTFNIVSGTFNDGFQMPIKLPSLYTIAYVARYKGDKNNTTYNRRIFDSDIGIRNYLWGFHANVAGRTYNGRIGWTTTTDTKMSDPNYWLIGVETQLSSRFNGIDFTAGYVRYDNYSFPSNTGLSPVLTINYGYLTGLLGNSSETSNWDIAELIIYSSELTETEQIALENYLAIKYRHFSFKTVVPTIISYKALTTQVGTYDGWFNIWNGGQYGYRNLKWYGPGWGTFFTIGTNWYWGYSWLNTNVTSVIGYSNRNNRNVIYNWKSPIGATNLHLIAGGGGGGGGGNYGGGGGGAGLVYLLNLKNVSDTKIYFNTGGIGQGGYYQNTGLYTTSGGDTSINYIITSNNINTSNIITAYGGAQGAQGSRLYGLGGNYGYCPRQYPPIVFNTTSGETTTTLLNKTVYVETISITCNLFYGKGNYIIYSSSTFSAYFKSLLFDFNLYNVGCHFGLSLYTNGIYNSTNNIKNDYLGDWLIIKFPTAINLSYFIIVARSGVTYRAPAEWKLYGSNDGITFTEIPSGSQSTRLTTSDYNFINSYTKIVNSSIYYLYYGICINKLTGTDILLNFSQLQFYGDEPNINFVSSTDIKQYPPKIYDSSTTEATSTGELANILPTTYYKGTITINTYTNGYGIGVYTLYTSSFYGEKKLLFDYNTSGTSSTWAISGTYSQPSGTYSGASYIVSGYTGDWIIIKFPYPIILAKFLFYGRSGYITRSPGLWKCYGSNDGIIFNEIIEGSNSTTSLTSSNYPYLYYQKILSTFSIPYLYIGFTINKLVGGDMWAYCLDFCELQIFGRETNIKVYPPEVSKTSPTAEKLVEFLNKSCYSSTIIINASLTYGNGTYLIYTSSTSNDNTKYLLFNYSSFGNGVSWDAAKYNSSGVYIGTSYISTDYLGDWVIIQLPKPITIVYYTIRARTSYETSAPGEWKMYGSNDGYIFYEIINGSQTTRLTTTNYTSSSGVYTKTVSNITTPYLYYGIVVNKLAGSSTVLNFTAINFYGIEISNIGGSGGLGYATVANDYLGGSLYQPPDTIIYENSSTTLWSIINTQYSIVSLNSLSVSGNSSGNGGLGSRDAITTENNARHGQNGGWGFAIALLDYNYSDVIVYTGINYTNDFMVLDTGKYYLTNNFTFYDNTIKSIKVSNKYKVFLYDGSALDGGCVIYKDNDHDLTNIGFLISSIQIKTLVSIYKSNNYGGDFLYLDVGNNNISTITGWDNSINSIKIPAGHNYKVTCYVDIYTGSSIVLTADTPNLSLSGFSNNISSIIIEDLSGVGLFTEINYIGKIAYIENPSSFDLYGSGNNDNLSSVIVPSGYSLYLTENAYNQAGGNKTITSSVADLTTVSFNNSASWALITLLNGVRLFKLKNLYGDYLYLTPGNTVLSGTWINSVNSISLSSGYTATCYIANNYTGTNIVLTKNVQDLSTLAFSNNIQSITIVAVL
jgi:hypothetical protein